ncbi:hypothetical protein ANCCAN_27348 [Ancylostoma caninum]|uniref:Uncharacterized protein n=1 Tax=Ancylostoma caninum TaxID=29170 RepID=A0A368F4B1_ANCCA|nr:hypothetical protein ANCCAN_27348 [Ancylostoma caninum]
MPSFLPTTKHPVFAEARQVLASHFMDDLDVQLRKINQHYTALQFQDALLSFRCHISRVLSH